MLRFKRLPRVYRQSLGQSVRGRSTPFRSRRGLAETAAKAEAVPKAAAAPRSRKLRLLRNVLGITTVGIIGVGSLAYYSRMHSEPRARPPESLLEEAKLLMSGIDRGVAATMCGLAIILDCEPYHLLS